MNHQCPYCSGMILRHISANRIYWYCPSCHQEVPLLSDRNLVSAIARKPDLVTSNSQRLTRPIKTRIAARSSKINL